MAPNPKERRLVRFAILALVILPSVSTGDDKSCDLKAVLVELTRESWAGDSAGIERIRPAWGSLSNPREHNPEHFAYLVHAFDVTSETKILERASTIHRNPNLSLSLVSQDYVGTFFDIKTGFILDVPETLIVATRPRDMIDSVLSPELMKTFGIHAPEYLLKQSIEMHTAERGWNEVRVRGTGERFGSTTVRVSAVFYKEGTPPEQLSNLRDAAARLGIPVIRISRRSP